MSQSSSAWKQDLETVCPQGGPLPRAPHSGLAKQSVLPHEIICTVTAEARLQKQVLPPHRDVLGLGLML